MTTDTFKPILFSTEMVQAILAGRKTQTRRVTVDWDQHKPKFIISGQGMYGDKYPTPSKYMAHFRYPEESTDSVGLVAPIQPGDILWVRETWKAAEENEYGIKYLYKEQVHENLRSSLKFKPSIFMPKEAARIFLKVTNVRAERLQDISEEDAIAEGCTPYSPQFTVNKDHIPARIFFRSLWDSINAKKHPWESNPWVWVYEFERIEKPENFLP